MTAAKEDIARLLAGNIVRTRYEDLPPEAVEATKRCILDTLGVTAAASTLGQGCAELVDLVKESGATGKSTIIGFGGSAPSWLAGFANGSMTHQLDYDDVHDEAGLHPSACPVIAAFAVAQEVGPVSGKELIAAVTLAIDLSCRIGFSITRSSWGRKTAWFMPSIGGIYAATAVAGRLLRLDEEGMLSAFGHALQQTSGSFQMEYSPGSVMRGIRDAFPIKAGILSALMAKRNLPGTKDAFEGRGGLYPLYFQGTYDRSCLTDELGKRYEGSGVSFKPWPSARVTHSSLDAALQILREQNIPPENIAEIQSAFDEPVRVIMEPLELRRRPPTITDAKVSLPFTMGVIAARRKMVVQDFTLEGLQDPQVLQLAQKVTGRVEPAFAGKKFSRIVEIRTVDGRKYSKQVDFAYGNPKRPISKEDLVAKFKDCMSYSAKPLAPQGLDKVTAMLDGLEELGDAGELMRLLS